VPIHKAAGLSILVVGVHSPVHPLDELGSLLVDVAVAVPVAVVVVVPRLHRRPLIVPLLRRPLRRRLFQLPAATAVLLLEPKQRREKGTLAFPHRRYHDQSLSLETPDEATMKIWLVQLAATGENRRCIYREDATGRRRFVSSRDNWPYKESCS
jgi:hypothetical protein